MAVVRHRLDPHGEMRGASAPIVSASRRRGKALHGALRQSRNGPYPALTPGTHRTGHCRRSGTTCCLRNCPSCRAGIVERTCRRSTWRRAHTPSSRCTRCHTGCTTCNSRNNHAGPGDAAVLQSCGTGPVPWVHAHRTAHAGQREVGILMFASKNLALLPAKASEDSTSPLPPCPRAPPLERHETPTTVLVRLRERASRRPHERPTQRRSQGTMKRAARAQGTQGIGGD